MEQIQVLEMLASGIQPIMTQCGFTGSKPYERGSSSVLDYSGDKGKARFVFNDDRIHLLFGEKDAESEDDSAFTADTTYLFVLSEYGERDVKSLVNEIGEYMSDLYIEKKVVSKKTKAPATVSKSAARSGALCYDPVTLATRLAGMYPDTKDEIKKNIEENGEFLCEDFFCNVMNRYIVDTINTNNPKEMKRLFNILGEVYEDGTNEVQSLIAVTILGEVDYTVLLNNAMPYMTDTMLEPVTTVSKTLNKSNSARVRLANPPKYKAPKKKKSAGLLQTLMGGGAGLQQ